MSDNNEILSRKHSFVINNEHADLVVNDLLEGNYEALGRIFTDLVNFNLFGDESLTENACEDKAERSARKLLRSDSQHYIENWVARSKQNSKNRTAGIQPTNDEIRDYARAKGYDEQACVGWCIEKAKAGWIDDNGEPIRYWKKMLDSYMRNKNKSRLNDMARGIGR